MYAPVEAILEMIADPYDDRPLVLVEYLYQICNSGGGAHKFREFTESYPRFQGGYVWDWQDKCLWATAGDGTKFFGYGGDFGESYTDKTWPLYMTCNGVVQPDLTWKPMTYELKQVYAPVWIEKDFYANAWMTTFSRTKLVLKNRSFTESAADYLCTAYLRENGVVVAERQVELPDVKPGGEARVDCEIPFDKKQGCEYHLDVVLKRKKALWFEDEGDEVFRTQIEQDRGPGAAAVPVSSSGSAEGAPVSVTDGDLIVVKAGTVDVSFDKATGRLAGLSKNGKTVIIKGGEPRFDRPRTGLDCDKDNWIWFPETSVFYGSKTKAVSVSVIQSETAAVIAFDLVTETKKSALITGRITYTIMAGEIKVGYFAKIPGDYELVSRVGLRFTLAGGYKDLTYLGYGPNECYSDRMQSAWLGVHETTVEETHFAFIPPSECGGHEGTRWLSLGNGDDTLTFTGFSPFHFDAHHNTSEDYRAAKHEHELVRRDEITLHIDAVHAPIGSNMGWSSGIERDKVPSGFGPSYGGYYIGFKIELD